jgi:short-chain fatty acids transporter
MNSRPEQDDGGALTQIGMAISDWAERWLPDALVFAMLAIVVVFVAQGSPSEAPRRTW